MAAEMCRQVGWRGRRGRPFPVLHPTSSTSEEEEERVVRVTVHSDTGFNATRALPFTTDDFIGECRVDGNSVTTFDLTDYDAEMDDGCQYLVVASNDPRISFAILVDRAVNYNEELQLMLSGDLILIGLRNRMLTINQVAIPLENEALFVLELPGSGRPLLRARRFHLGEVSDYNSLQVDLPEHHLQLLVGPGAEFHVKAGRDLRGRVQGLCGDLSEESLFKFRGPRRCVLSSGSVMAASYQTSSGRPQCRIRPDLAHRLQDQQKDCAKLEGTATSLRWTVRNFH